MTQTGRWLEELRNRFVRRETNASLLLTTGSVLFALALGLLFARLDIYRALPASLFLTWGVVVVALVWGFHRSTRPRLLTRSFFADRLELQGGLRRGFLRGLVGDFPGSESPGLIRMADARASEWLHEYGSGNLQPMESASKRSLRRNGVIAAVGVAVFIGSGPASRGAASFWLPWNALSGSDVPILIAADHAEVRRGDDVIVSIEAGPRRSVILWSRAPGEGWSSERVDLDSLGRADLTVGPLASDRFLRATSGRTSSDTLHLRVLFPIFVSELSLIARYPRYLERPDEPLFPGHPVVLPRGTRVTTQGRASVPLVQASWRSSDGVVSLRTDEHVFSGSLTVTRSAVWQLVVEPRDGVPDEDPYSLTVIAVGDSAPQVAVAIPGVDTTPPLTLLQPLVIDVRDDNRVTAVELVTRRVNRLGIASEPSVTRIPLPEGGTERAMLQWTLDLDGLGFLPGDTAFYRVRAYDNAPVRQMSSTREFMLRIPSSREMRQRLSEQASGIIAGADSLARLQRKLERLTEELTAGGGAAPERSNGGRQSDERELAFNTAERSRALSAEQERLLERASQLRDELRELQQTAWEAGITDPEWHEELSRIQELLGRAITSELQEKLRALAEALDRLDTRSSREALEELLQAQRRMREELERSLSLFERAALEGELTSLAEEAEELARRQQEWNEVVASGDTSLAQLERELAELTDSLAARLAELNESVRESSGGTQGTEEPQARAQSAAEHMRRAAESAGRGENQHARREGEAARENLASIPEQLTRRRDELRQMWRREVLEMMDHALMETAGLARRQSDVERRIGVGESGPDVRGEQAAIRDGVDRVIWRLQLAAGKNALVSPSLAAALGFTKLRMTEALLQIQQATPNTREAARRAGEAVDGLNTVAHALLRSRSDVSGAASGSGVQEALQRLAELAEQQGSMNSESGELLPLMQGGGERLIQRLRDLAMQQRQLATELERLGAQHDVTGAGALAQEAEDIADDLEEGHLDRDTIERQERLFRRLLDAGRTLRSDDPDENLERQGETAREGNVRIPAVSASEIPGGELRYPYPGWDALVVFTPEERRLVLEYFRRINENR